MPFIQNHKKNNKDHKKDFQYICHKLNIGNDWKFITLYLPPEAIEAHIAHGDSHGECSNSSLNEDGIYTDNDSNQNASCDCSGNVTQLKLRYNGTEDAIVSVTATNVKKVLYRKRLSPGDDFKLIGFDSEGTLGSEIHITVKGKYNTTIDTSCPDPNILGYTYGDFTIEGGSSLNGGEFCQGVVM